MKLAATMSEASFCGRTKLASHTLSAYAQVLVAKLLVAKLPGCESECNNTEKMYMNNRPCSAASHVSFVYHAVYFRVDYDNSNDYSSFVRGVSPFRPKPSRPQSVSG